MCYLTIVVLSYLIGRAMFGPYSTMDRVYDWNMGCVILSYYKKYVTFWSLHDKRLLWKPVSISVFKTIFGIKDVR